ncbi:hypothetical protein IC229_00125 [Spirosoma sp. BT702]|uniref:YD repeat-containing protein n=1 Tax=Spirosoma profusum TaxID=2771354 RepID=A0A926XSG3_9BACT|nr:hypothetical protein [Spirosoma profusum]MBD2699023.1 hypothetical protein [Spirosoma profusum]
MKLLLRLNYPLALAIIVFACQPKDEPALAPVCQLTSTTDQLIETSGQLTDELKRTFTYSGNALTSLSERSKNSDASFQIEYNNSLITRANSGQDVITLTYGSATLPNSATFTRSGKVQSTFSMEYAQSGNLTRITENRQILPSSSTVTERSYTFTYDNAGNLTNERGRFVLAGGAIGEQEVEYTFDQKPSPYTHVTELPILTLIALSQAVEAKPGRFWHINTPITQKMYNINSGNRSMIESSTFKPVYDADSKITTQAQTALLYLTGSQTPFTKNNRQTFGYQCQ